MSQLTKLKEKIQRIQKEKKKENYNVNNKYTKKQITEAIAYWEKQLKIGNYKKLDESCLNEGLFSWLGNLFSPKEKAASGMKDGDISVQSKVIEGYLDAAKKYVQKAYKDEDWNKAGTAAIQAGDMMNNAWSNATSRKDRESIARVAVALAAKLQYAKSNSSYEYACVTFCNKLDKEMQDVAKKLTTNQLLKKCFSGWTGPESVSSSGKKGVPGTGWNYDPARGGHHYDDGY